AIVGEMLGLAAHRAVPVEAEPAQVGLDRRFEFAPAAADVDVLDAQQEPPARLARAAPGNARRAGMAEMQLPGRACREARDQRHGRRSSGTAATTRSGMARCPAVYMRGNLQVRRAACYAKSMAPVVLDAGNLKRAMRHLARVDPDFARAIEEVGHPELRIVPSGFGGLMRSIVGQQISGHAARAVWLRLRAALPYTEPAGLLRPTTR